jgi:hypothetical protein
MNQILLLAEWEWPTFLNRPETAAMAVPIAAIFVFGVIMIAKLLLRHRERMAMIERGMHPDNSQKQGNPQDQS